MSNYSSLFRVLSPSRVQTKIEENSLPARSNRYMAEITLFCYVLDTPVNSAIPVDIGKITKVNDAGVPIENLTYGHIKKLIWPNNDKVNELRLWKVEISREEKKKKLETLNEKFRENIDMTDELGEELDTTDPFPADYKPPPKTIHIVVEPPKPAITAKRPLDLDYWNEVRDRKKGKLTAPVPELNNAQIIMERIMNLPEDPDFYSDPKNSLLLPFPFIGSLKPVERFILNKDFSFTFIGRREFKNALDNINKLQANCGYMEMFIYGTMGYGKSYILSAITCYLFRIKKRVVYLPDCRALSMQPVNYIKSALFLTYVNDLEEINRISLCKTLDDIIDFFESEDGTLYIIIDQLNALDEKSDTGVNSRSRMEIKESINKMRYKHLYIKSASANNEWALRYMRKQTNEIKMALYGGLKEDEMLEWWKRHGSDESEHQMKEIEDITGCVPLFLRYFIESKGDDDNFDSRKNRLIEDWEIDMKPNLEQFSLDKITSESEFDRNRYVEVMTSFITNNRLPARKEGDYDHRYFYVEKGTEIGRYVCGLARNYMAKFLYERSKMNVFTDIKWINSMKMFRDNPSVLGFFMEKACIASIYRDGLMVDNASFKPDRTEFFSSEDDIVVREKKCTFFIPYSWNNDAIDGLLLIHKKEKKNSSVHVIPIQITITKPSKHSDSEQKFFNGAWKKLKEKLANYGENVKVSFVWVTCRSETSKTIERNFKTLRGQVIEVNPGYNRVVIAFRTVNKDIDNEFLFSDRDI